MDWIPELWKAAQQAGPFASLFLLAALYFLNKDREQQISDFIEDRKELQRKYDNIVAQFISLAGNTSATLQDWRDMLIKAKDRDP